MGIYRKKPDKVKFDFEYTLDYSDFDDVAAFCDMMQFTEEDTDTEVEATVKGIAYAGSPQTRWEPEDHGELEIDTITILLPNGVEKNVYDLLTKDSIECIEEKAGEEATDLFNYEGDY